MGSKVLFFLILIVGLVGVLGCARSNEAKVTYEEVATYSKVVEGYPITVRLRRTSELRFINASAEITREIIFTRDGDDSKSPLQRSYPEGWLTPAILQRLEQDGFKQSGYNPLIIDMG